MRQFKFRKKRAARHASRHIRIEQRIEGGSELAGIHKPIERLSEDLRRGKISKEEAGEMLFDLVERLTAQESEFCVVCEKPKENPDALVCDACSEEVEIDRTVEIEIDFSDDD
ncbi:MAG: hypothetical protein JSV86_03775 [Gemmatimonadota bacterium]|nr:MAG: hypothetical protein JSV86_03775 [Gemmatimonadota bacterium]